MDRCDDFTLSFDFKQYKNEIRRQLIRKSLIYESTSVGFNTLYGTILDRNGSNPNITEHQCSSYGDENFSHEDSFEM